MEMGIQKSRLHLTLYPGSLTYTQDGIAVANSNARYLCMIDSLVSRCDITISRMLACLHGFSKKRFFQYL